LRAGSESLDFSFGRSAADAGVMRVPVDGSTASSAAERTVMNSPRGLVFTGSVYFPWKTAPASSRMTSPGAAAVSAACRFAPAGT
jgi:hypothetical protein